MEEFTDGISHTMEDRMSDKATKDTTNPKPTALPPEVVDASDAPTVRAEVAGVVLAAVEVLQGLLHAVRCAAGAACLAAGLESFLGVAA